MSITGMACILIIETDEGVILEVNGTESPVLAQAVQVMVAAIQATQPPEGYLDPDMTEDPVDPRAH